MRAPTIHLNGTSRDQLLASTYEARAALRQAMDKLYAVFPNARDYYTQEAGAVGEAERDWRAMHEKLAAVDGELVELLEAIEYQP